MEDFGNRTYANEGEGWDEDDDLLDGLLDVDIESSSEDEKKESEPDEVRNLTEITNAEHNQDIDNNSSNTSNEEERPLKVLNSGINLIGKTVDAVASHGILSHAILNSPAFHEATDDDSRNEQDAASKNESELDSNYDGKEGTTSSPVMEYSGGLFLNRFTQMFPSVTGGDRIEDDEEATVEDGWEEEEDDLFDDLDDEELDNHVDYTEQRIDGVQENIITENKFSSSIILPELSQDERKETENEVEEKNIIMDAEARNRRENVTEDAYAAIAREILEYKDINNENENCLDNMEEGEKVLGIQIEQIEGELIQQSESIASSNNVMEKVSNAAFAVEEEEKNTCLETKLLDDDCSPVESQEDAGDGTRNKEESIESRECVSGQEELSNHSVNENINEDVLSGEDDIEDIPEESESKMDEECNGGALSVENMEPYPELTSNDKSYQPSAMPTEEELMIKHVEEDVDINVEIIKCDNGNLPSNSSNDVSKISEIVPLEKRKEVDGTSCGLEEQTEEVCLVNFPHSGDLGVLENRNGNDICEEDNSIRSYLEEKPNVLNSLPKDSLKALEKNNLGPSFILNESGSKNDSTENVEMQRAKNDVSANTDLASIKQNFQSDKMNGFEAAEKVRSEANGDICKGFEDVNCLYATKQRTNETSEDVPDNDPLNYETNDENNRNEAAECISEQEGLTFVAIEQSSNVEDPNNNQILNDKSNVELKWNNAHENFNVEKSDEADYAGEIGASEAVPIAEVETSRPETVEDTDDTEQKKEIVNENNQILVKDDFENADDEKSLRDEDHSHNNMESANKQSDADGEINAGDGWNDELENYDIESSHEPVDSNDVINHESEPTSGDENLQDDEDHSHCLYQSDEINAADGWNDDLENYDTESSHEPVDSNDVINHESEPTSEVPVLPSSDDEKSLRDEDHSHNNMESANKQSDADGEINAADGWNDDLENYDIESSHEPVDSNDVINHESEPTSEVHLLKEEDHSQCSDQSDEINAADGWDDNLKNCDIELSHEPVVGDDVVNHESEPTSKVADPLPENDVKNFVKEKMEPTLQDGNISLQDSKDPCLLSNPSKCVLHDTIEKESMEDTVQITKEQSILRSDIENMLSSPNDVHNEAEIAYKSADTNLFTLQNSSLGKSDQMDHYFLQNEVSNRIGNERDLANLLHQISALQQKLSNKEGLANHFEEANKNMEELLSLEKKQGEKNCSMWNDERKLMKHEIVKLEKSLETADTSRELKGKRYKEDISRLELLLQLKEEEIHVNQVKHDQNISAFKQQIQSTDSKREKERDSLTVKLKSKSKYCDELCTKNDHLQKTLADLKLSLFDQTKEQEKKEKEMNLLLQQMEKQGTKKQDEITTLTKKIGKIQSELSAKSKLCDEKDSLIDSLNKSVAKLESDSFNDTKTHARKLKELEIKMNRNEAEKEDITSQYEAKLQKLETQKQHLKGENKTIENHFRNQEGMVVPDLKQKIEALTEEKERIKTELTQQKTLVNEVESKLSESVYECADVTNKLNAELEQMKMKVQENENRHHEVACKYKDMCKSHKEAIKNYETLQHEKYELEEELEEALVQMGLQKELSAEEIHEYEERLSSLELKFETQKKEYENDAEDLVDNQKLNQTCSDLDLERKFEQMSNAHNALKIELDQIKDEHFAKEIEIKELFDKNLKLLDQVDHLQMTVDLIDYQEPTENSCFQDEELTEKTNGFNLPETSNEKVDKSETLLANLKKKDDIITVYKGMEETMQKRIEEVDAKLTHSSHEEARLQEKLTEVQNLYMELKKEISRKQDRIDKMEVELLSSELKLNAKEVASSDVNESYVVEQEDLQIILKEKENEILELQLSIESIKSRLITTQAELAEQKMKVCGGTSEATDERDIEFEAQQEKIEFLEASLLEHENAYQEATSLLEVMNTDIETTHNVLTEKEKELQELVELVTELEVKLQQSNKPFVSSDIPEADTKDEAESVDFMREQIIYLANALEQSETQRAEAIDRILTERKANSDTIKRLKDSVKRFYSTLSCSES